MYRDRELERLKKKEYYKKNRDALLEKMRLYYEKNKDAIKGRVKEWQDANPDKVVAYKRKYREENLELCRKASRDSQRERRMSDPEYRRRCLERTKEWKAINRNNYWSWIKTQYGVSKEQYAEMLAYQRYRCPICNEEPVKWVVDHCHKSGKVRGILCDPCNTLIGKIEKSPERHRRAMNYIEDHNNGDLPSFRGRPGCKRSRKAAKDLAI